MTNNDNAARLLHPASSPAPRLQVLVLVDAIDDVTQTAIAYAQSLEPAQLCAIHVVWSPAHARRLQLAWAAGAPATVPLLLVDPVQQSVALTLGPVINGQLVDGAHPVLLLVPDRSARGSPFERQSAHHELAAFSGMGDVFVVWVTPTPT